MQRQFETKRSAQKDNNPQVPNKAEILEALQRDHGHGDMPLEWLLDHNEKREGTV